MGEIATERRNLDALGLPSCRKARGAVAMEINSCAESITAI